MLLHFHLYFCFNQQREASLLLKVWILFTIYFQLIILYALKIMLGYLHQLVRIFNHFDLLILVIQNQNLLVPQSKFHRAYQSILLIHLLYFNLRFMGCAKLMRQNSIKINYPHGHLKSIFTKLLIKDFRLFITLYQQVPFHPFISFLDFILQRNVFSLKDLLQV